jgi:hypothetical protein
VAVVDVDDAAGVDIAVVADVTSTVGPTDADTELLSTSFQFWALSSMAVVVVFCIKLT